MPVSLSRLQERWLLGILAAIQFTHIVDFMIMMPLGPQLMRLFSIQPQQFSLLVSAYTFSAGASGFLSAFFIDRFDRKSALRFLYIGFLVGTLACAMASTYPLLLAARVLTGMFGGILGALLLSIVGDAIPAERRGSAMGVVMAAFALASVFGVPLGLFLANLFSWHAPFLFLVGVGIFIAAGIQWAMPSMRGHMTSGPRPHPMSVLTRMATDRNQQLALLMVVLIMFGGFSVIPFISPYMVANVGFSEQQLTYIYLIGGGFTIFTSPLVGKLADKLGKAQVFSVFLVLSLIPIFLITHMPALPIPVALIVTSLFFITLNGRMIPSMALITSAVEPAHRGSFMSLQSSVQQLASGSAALVAGLIVSKGPDGQLLNYPLVGYLAMASSLLTLLVVKRLQTRDGSPPPVATEAVLETASAS
jgi:DHA1 family inner membrane transport protein